MNNKNVFDLTEKELKGNNNSNNNSTKGGFIAIGIIISFIIIFLIVCIASCDSKEYDFYPNFDETTYVERAETEVKKKLNYPSTAIFSVGEAEAYKDDSGVHVMATGKVSASNAFGTRTTYIYYVKFNVDVENNTYTALPPILREY